MTKITTLGLSGLGRDDEAALRTLFDQANARLGHRWAIVPEADAAVLLIDVDSIYGHMTWLKVHSGERPIIAFTASERSDAPIVLRRPGSAEQFAAILGELSGIAPSAAAQPAPAKAPEPAPAPAAPATAPAAEAAKPAPPPAPAQAPAPAPEPVAPPRDPMLADHLLAGALPGPVRFNLDGCTPLVLDPKSETYLGPAALKGFLPYCKAVIRREDWQALSPAEFERLKAELGGAQPLVRLAWLCGLASGDGTLSGGRDPNERYKLLKWPQIEREFPKHFRIATVMMKGPQLLTEIAETSGATLAEVSDFINAYAAIGFAEADLPAPAADAAAGQKGSLFGRLRGK